VKHEGLDKKTGNERRCGPNQNRTETLRARLKYLCVDPTEAFSFQYEVRETNPIAVFFNSAE
jgi:hypothetical protein